MRVRCASIVLPYGLCRKTQSSYKWFLYFFNLEARGIKRRFLLLYFLAGAIQRITQEPGAGAE